MTTSQFSTRWYKHFATFLRVAIVFAMVFMGCLGSSSQALQEGVVACLLSSARAETTELWDSKGEYFEGCACIKRGDLYGYIDAAGAVIIEPQYDWAEPFSNGKARVEKDGVAFYIDRKGNVLSTDTLAPEPTLTPSPKPTATSQKVPQPPELKQGPQGIRIRIPSRLNQATAYDIYRAKRKSGFQKIATLSAKESVYLDIQLEMNEEYQYAYVARTAKAQYPMSKAAEIRWTQYSQLYNLRVRQDESDIRTLHITWEDVVESEYDVQVNILDANNTDVSWYWSGMTIDALEMDYTHALPNTAFRITVTDPITKKRLVKEIKLPKAKSYSAYGAKSLGGEAVWVAKADIDSGKNAWDIRNDAYKTMNQTQFLSKSQQYYLFCKSSFGYTRASDAHTPEELFILRSPSGRIAYAEYPLVQIEPAGKNWKWDWYYNLSYLLSNVSNSIQGGYLLFDTGTYSIEHYFDNRLVNTVTFKIAN